MFADPCAVACFYVRFTGLGKSPRDLYRAIYLSERTVRDFVKQILKTLDSETLNVSHVMHVNDKGLRIMVDDNVVRELTEGQDMTADITEASDPNGSAPGVAGSSFDIKLTY